MNLIDQFLKLLIQHIQDFIRGIKVQGNIRIQIPVNKPKLLKPAKGVKRVVRTK